MKSTIVKRSICPLTAVVMAALPIGHVWNTAQAAVPEKVVAVAKAKTYKGSLEQMQQWGPIQVSIVVKSKKLTGVKVVAESHTGRSADIQSHAIPMLKQETLNAQSASIDTISGATDTSGAYITSLQAAVKAARHAKALK